MCDYIGPALNLARKAGLTVCHVQCETIALRYPEWYEAAAPAPSGGAPREAIPGYTQAIQERSHGVDYNNKSGLARLDFPQVVAPLPGEPIVCQTERFDAILRARGIVNLIYMGFATDMCLLNAPAGMGPMFSLGYRVLLIREATLGVELPDTFAERLATRWGIRFLETHWGDTIGFEDFVENGRRILGQAAVDK